MKFILQRDTHFLKKNNNNDVIGDYMFRKKNYNWFAAGYFIGLLLLIAVDIYGFITFKN